MRRLQHASKNGDLRQMAWLLDCERVPVDSFDPKSKTHAHAPTQMAAASGNGLEALKLLASHNADFFILSRTGMALEDIAAKHKDPSSIDFILRMKAHKAFGLWME